MLEPNRKRSSVVIVGGGPAGLTAAYRLAEKSVPSVVLEMDPKYVGGISRTVRYGGCRFDIGPHRFFSKSSEIEGLWNELLGEQMLTHQRKTRIFWRGRFFSYPLRPLEALMALGPAGAVSCGLSYLKERLRPARPQKNFEAVMIHLFGERLYRIFFKDYTEKVWGMSCSEISADWARQRIQGLSLRTALMDALRPRGRSRGPDNEKVKTLISEFRYPEGGAGMLWEETARRAEAHGGAVRLGRKVVTLRRTQTSWEVVHVDVGSGAEETIAADHVISSAALPDVVSMLEPAPPETVLRAAEALRFRDLIIVGLIVRGATAFDDHWIYVQEPGYRVGRILGSGSWSDQMVKDPSLTAYGLEYFSFAGDDLWQLPDRDLIDLATDEFCSLGMAVRDDILDGMVVRQPRAYPIYDDTYMDHVTTIRGHFEETLGGLHQVGRNGMHRYNNQDHSMMTAMLTVKNILSGEPGFDPWTVNQDAEYHESGSAGGEHHPDLRGG